MLRDSNSFKHIYIACGYTDMRRGIDGLVATIKGQFKLDAQLKIHPFQTLVIELLV